MAQRQQQPDKDNPAIPATAGRQPGSMSKSMHDGIAVWCDCCSCEMEPYWAEAVAEAEMEFGDSGK